uniref:Wound-responsive family protein n=1 Tax=Leersia perrieri TaxID=77586 RepID=A0A0D9WA19_9ORYZ
MASGGGKAKASSWAAAMSVGTVEALKDQAGLCRWNYAFRSLQQRGRQQAAVAGSGGGGARALQPAAPTAKSAAARRKAKQEEEELRTVMYLSNWGPNN